MGSLFLITLFGDLVVGSPSWIVPSLIAACFAAFLVFASYVRTPVPWSAKSIPAILKFVAFSVLLFCLVEPLMQGVRPRPGANAFSVIVDNSQSMAINPDTPKSFKKLLDPKTDWLTRLEQDFDVRRYVFDEQLQNVDEFGGLEFQGTSSSLTSSLKAIASRFSKRPTAGALIFTDGNGTDLDTDFDWNQLGFPVFPVVPDTNPVEQDLSVADIRVTQTNFEAAPTTVEAVVSCIGLKGMQVVGKITDAHDKVIIEETVTVEDDNQDVPIRFKFRPDSAGLSFYELTACLKGDEDSLKSGKSKREQTLRNNTRSVAVDRGGGPYRVLYLAGRPNWEFKFLRRALSDDEEIKLIGLIRIAKKEPKFTFRDQSNVSDTNRLFQGFENQDEQDTETYDQPVLTRFGVDSDDELRDGFPKTPEDLFAYHAIIIDDLEAKFFTEDQMTLLRRFVSERGGGLMMLGGMESFAAGRYDKTPVGDLLPVYSTADNSTSLDASDDSDKRGTSALRWNLSREGMLQPWARTRSTDAAEKVVQADMPEFLTINLTGGVKPGSSTLAEALDGDKKRPLLVTQQFGKGRTSALLVGDMWRWSMKRPANQDDDLAQFWRQTVRWLVADVPKRVELSHSKYQPGRPIKIETIVRNEEFQPLDNARVSMKLTSPSGLEFETAAQPTSRPGIYELDYAPREDGPYRVVTTVVADDGSDVGSRTSGWTATPATAEFESLQPDRQRMEQIAKQTGGELLSAGDLDRFVKSLPNRKVPVTESWIYPIWHHPFVLGLAILCLCGEWGFRRLRGMP